MARVPWERCNLNSEYNHDNFEIHCGIKTAYFIDKACMLKFKEGLLVSD